MGTKKLLAAYDPTHPDAQPGEMLIPWIEAGVPTLTGIKTGKPYSHGVAVYVGREVTDHDVFAKIVDAGRRIADVDQATACIARYVNLMRDQKIGTVVSVRHEGPSPLEFCLDAEPAHVTSKSKLP